MGKKINFGKTLLSELFKILNFESMDALYKRRPRLFPIGKTEDEKQTTSILLSSLFAVKEFKEELLREIGQDKIINKNSQLHIFTELTNQETGDRPDGLMVLTSNINNPKIEWASFIEAKVGKNLVTDEQIAKYVKFACDIGIDSIITISNAFVSSPLNSPNFVKKRNFNLYHWSWTYISVLANRLVRDGKIEDSDHVYILTELRRFLFDNRNISHFDNMGKDWKKNVEKFQSLYGKKKDDTLIEYLVNAYNQEEKDVSLHLTEESLFHIKLVNSDNHLSKLKELLITKNIFKSSFIVNEDKKNGFDIEVNLISKEIKCITTVEIKKGKAQAQSTALVNMFPDNVGIADKIIVAAIYPYNKCVDDRVALSTLIKEKKTGKTYSIVNKCCGDEIKEFKLLTIDDIGKEIGSSTNFIKLLETIALRFLNQVIAFRKNI